MQRRQNRYEGSYQKQGRRWRERQLRELELWLTLTDRMLRLATKAIAMALCLLVVGAGLAYLATQL